MSGGVIEFVKYLDRNKKAIGAVSDHDRGPTMNGIGVEAALCGGTTATTRTCCASPTTSRQRDGRHPSGRFPRRADAPRSTAMPRPTRRREKGSRADRR